MRDMRLSLLSIYTAAAAGTVAEKAEDTDFAEAVRKVKVLEAAV